MGGEVKELEARANELSKVSFPLGRSSAEPYTPQPTLDPKILHATNLKAPWTILKRNRDLLFICVGHGRIPLSNPGSNILRSLLRGAQTRNHTP